ncbi:dihydrofolate reductase [Luteipulveratus flavus]|uniref:dihydrofolate reductase n=1 Tax=Luteipulveratus flavus TaxID=3031728 RepID=A0ABT6C8S0_9MICO|nr:dihydrofolate reductase [Luteipulveratus sp. YIM 133296]MDF8265321.1 dihydrofolate reductase [Luteipulveratus sp. YIM 133296]
MTSAHLARDRHARVPLVPASYVVLTRESEGRTEVALQLRRGTDFMDGWWACAAAGHVEAGESAASAAVSEAREELGVVVDPADLEPLTTVQRHSLTGLPVEQRADFFFRVRRWQGEPTLREPDKAAEMRWFALDALPERLVPHERQVIEAMAAGQVPPVMERGFAQRLTLVAAMGRNRVIGRDGDMPWHLSEDLKRFKALTIGGTMIMGRGTWDSIGRALPGRTTIVITRDLAWSAPGAVVAHSLPEALTAAPDTELFIAGGGEIYAQTIALADRLELTLVEQSPEGDTYFPEVDPQDWRETARETRDGFAWVTYDRVR